MLRWEIFAQGDALINVPGDDLCVIAVTAFIHIQYGTWQPIHQCSTVTFNHTDETLLTVLED